MKTLGAGLTYYLDKPNKLCTVQLPLACATARAILPFSACPANLAVLGQQAAAAGAVRTRAPPCCPADLACLRTMPNRFRAGRCHLSRRVQFCPVALWLLLYLQQLLPSKCSSERQGLSDARAALAGYHQGSCVPGTPAAQATHVNLPPSVLVPGRMLLAQADCHTLPCIRAGSSANLTWRSWLLAERCHGHDCPSTAQCRLAVTQA